ncbi:hypothetical protein [Chamaesiphon polymorphus]|uniref:hypothetical protein n=1 Tax=Chamaesiphon polymorphus TaxID=2107691 RepID=UPI0011B27D3E|nr:hypothetical protein [Chamaesiphon polymorphus]
MDTVHLTQFMGVTLAYQAIPPESSFYARLQHDRAFMIMSIESFYSGYLFHFEPETLFPGGDDGEERWYSMSFRGWKEFYLLADDNNAEILMQVL